jgi:acetolactate synthase I/III small subunit
MSKHTLSVLMENTPGVLARTTSLFSRRGFNIESVAEGSTHDPRVSRITLVVTAGDHSIHQVICQIEKLVNVLEVVELAPDQAVQRELVLVKVRADHETRSRITEIAQHFCARTVDVCPGTLSLEATASSDRLSALLKMLEPYGIQELVRTGTIAIGRGPDAVTDQILPGLDSLAGRAAA